MIFRYPGGKSRLIDQLLPFIRTPIEETGRFADLFVGGGSVLLAVARDYPNIPLWANDADRNISAFWQMVAGEGDADALCAMLRTPPTMPLFLRLRAEEPTSLEERAYRAVFFNRTTFSGIASSGPIGGYANQENTKWKIDCRYNSEALVNEFGRMRVSLAGRLRATRKDAVAMVGELAEWALYLDPPYFDKGDMLYPVQFSREQHRALASILRSRVNWVLSYDDHPGIRGLYDWAIIDNTLRPRYSIDIEKEKRHRKTELVITPRGQKVRRLLEQSAIAYQT